MMLDTTLENKDVGNGWTYFRFAGVAGFAEKYLGYVPDTYL